MDVEKRYLQEVELRAGNEGKPAQIIGYAARFNSKSVDLGGFREVILPGAFTRTLARGRDVKATYNHDPRLVLGSTKAGTLRLEEDDRGLRVEIDPPETRADVVESIRRGDVNAMSFEFTVKPADEEMTRETAQNLRTLGQVELLGVGPATYPAYPQTSVSVRALDRAKAMTAAALETPNLDACQEKLEAATE